MKVVLIGPSINQKGGIASVIRGLQNFFLEKGIDFKIISTTTERKNIYKIFQFLSAWTRLFINCICSRNSVFHIHMASRGSYLRKFLMAFTCWISRSPFIIHLHGARFDQFYKNDLGWIGKFSVRFIFRKADQIIALSESWKAWIESIAGVHNVKVVFNGVPTRETIKRSFDGSSNILFLGRLGARKGVDELLSAIREVARDYPAVTLELAGDGDVEKYRALAHDMPYVKFLGWIDDSARSAALAKATIFCLPSWHEGLPMSILEAMSVGLPVVSTYVGGIPEAVIDDVSGILVEPGDVDGLVRALHRMLDDPKQAEEMGRAGKSQHEKLFSTEAMGNGCLKVYLACLSE